MNESDPSSAPTLDATSPAVSSQDPLPLGTTRLAGRYELLALLGEGGMGSVYRARDLELGEDVALKMLHRDLAEAPGMLDRFRQEARLARKVTHRNVARTFDIGEDGGAKFLTMEFVDGESLTHLLARRGRLPAAEAVALGASIAEGLSAAHAAGVIHRDLKPDNVLVARDGRVVITDFGIARALSDAGGPGGEGKTGGRIVGTPAYMAPEQVEGSRSIDERADVYAFGLLLFEALSGERAFLGGEPMAVAVARLLGPAPSLAARRPDLPPALSALVARCLERHPRDRFASADELLGALRSVQSSPAPPTSPISPISPTSPTSPISPVSPTFLAAPRGPASRPGDRTVAVLPLGSSEADAELAEGLSEQLVDTLSMARGLKVKSHAGPIRAGESPTEAGQRLGVQAVVHGSLRRQSDDVLMTLRLLGVDDGFQLWARRERLAPASLLDAVDEAARAIVGALQAESSPPPAPAIQNGAAVELFLRARRDYQHSPQSQARALQLIEEASRLAPDDPRILSALAMMLARSAFLGGASREASFQAARAAAERAIALAPQLGEPWAALATVRFQADDDAAGAVAALRRAVALAPSAAEPHELMGRILTEADLLPEAIAYLERSLWIDTQSDFAASDLGRAYGLLGDWARAEAVVAGYEQRGSTLWAYATRGRLALWRRLRPGLLPPEVSAAQGPQVLAVRLFWEAAQGALSAPSRAQIDHMLSVAPPRSRARRFFLQVSTELFAALGELDRASSLLEQAVDEGLRDLSWLRRLPLLDPLRPAPGFARLLAAVTERQAPVVAAFLAPTGP